MKIVISESINEPLYRQIAHQIEYKINRGELIEHTPLPSIRFLAKELSVSVITTTKAFEILYQDDLIYSVPGKGYFIKPYDKEKHLKLSKDFIRSQFKNIFEEAKNRGISKEEFLKSLKMYIEEIK